jgi:hypothetical protein
MLGQLCKRGSVSVDGSSLAVVRIVVGVIGVISMIRIVAYGWIDSLYVDPDRHFSYPGFGWVQPPGRIGMYALVIVVGVAAGVVAVGRRFRPALVVFLVGFGWIELIDVTTYLNHYWFLTLVGAVMLVAPMDAALVPGRRRRPVRVMWVWVLRGHLTLVYTFAGLAKLHADWLVHAQPLRLWLPARADVPAIGPLLAEPSTAYLLSWAGAVFDCTVVAALLWRRTRPFAWVGLVSFHVATWVLFPIGVFPWLMIGASTVFFDPDWPVRVRARLTRRSEIAHARVDAWASGPSPGTVEPIRGWKLALLAMWCAAMVLVPLRHHVIPGDARWTTEGYRFAWNVLLTERGADVEFRVVRADGVSWVESGADLYTPSQWKVMSSDPELIRQAAHVIADRHRDTGTDVAVHADVFVSLDGRPAQRLVDPNVDLAREPWRPFGQPWILPAPTGNPP